MRIPVYKPWLGEKEEQYVLQALQSGWISSKGEFVSRFEESFCRYVNAEHAISVSNGTVALHAALLALGIGPGDEVIVPTLTYVASANSVTYTGATPVFVDSVPGTWQMSPTDVRKVIGSRTKAIMAVHLYGLPCDLSKLKEIADENSLLLIEDCAEALGSFVGVNHVGCVGDISTFSFYGNKTITTGEGGMVVTDNPSLAERVRHIKGQGLAKYREYWHDIIGYNYRMTNICAAIGCAQLETIQEKLMRKAEIASFYRTRLSHLVEFQEEVDGMVHSHWMVSCLLDSSSLRDGLRESLVQKGIETRPVFYPIHSMPMYARSFRRMPVADSISTRGVNLPSYPTLTNSELVEVCDAVEDYLSGRVKR